jgi:hypothetical protein
MNKWYVVRVKFTKQLDNGAFKRVTEPYLVSAMSFTDAEARIYGELGEIIRGEFSVVGVTPKNYEDIFSYETQNEYWWEVAIKMQDANLDSDKIKMITNTYLVNGTTLPEALNNITESLNGTVSDMTIVGIKSSPIADIFPYKEVEKEETKELVEEKELN